MITEDMTVGELLEKCGMTLEDLKECCKDFMRENSIDTEGESIEDMDSPLSFMEPGVVETTGRSIEASERDTKVTKVAKLFARKLRNA